MANDKRTIYVGGLADEVSEKLVEQAFIPFGDITGKNPEVYLLLHFL